MGILWGEDLWGKCPPMLGSRAQHCFTAILHQVQLFTCHPFTPLHPMLLYPQQDDFAPSSFSWQHPPALSPSSPPAACCHPSPGAACFTPAIKSNRCGLPVAHLKAHTLRSAAASFLQLRSLKKNRNNL